VEECVDISALIMEKLLHSIDAPLNVAPSLDQAHPFKPNFEKKLFGHSNQFEADFIGLDSPIKKRIHIKFLTTTLPLRRGLFFCSHLLRIFKSSVHLLILDIE